MKKILIYLVAGFGLTVSSFAASTSVTVASGGFSNLTTVIPFFTLKAAQIIVTAPANNTANVSIYDVPTNSLTYTNAAYTTISSYATNRYFFWTNYYGATNYSGTNLVLVDITNNVAATTNTYTPVLTLFAPTNNTVTYQNLNQMFLQSMWITNTGSGNATLTVNYTQ